MLLLLLVISTFSTTRAFVPGDPRPYLRCVGANFMQGHWHVTSCNDLTVNNRLRVEIRDGNQVRIEGHMTSGLEGMLHIEDVNVDNQIIKATLLLGPIRTKRVQRVTAQGTTYVWHGVIISVEHRDRLVLNFQNHRFYVLQRLQPPKPAKEDVALPVQDLVVSTTITWMVTTCLSLLFK